MKILFNFASRSRPALFRRGVESIINNATGQYQICAIVDANDTRLKDYNFEGCSIVDNGLSANKVDAINRAHLHILNSGCDIIVNMSDDMVFTQKGFDEIIKKEFQKECFEVGYNALDLCLHLPDGNRSDLITMAILGIDYYKRFNYIYHPEYKSLYCDNEMTEVAKLLGKYKFVNENLFVHLHPAYGKAPFDMQYQHTESFNFMDKNTFEKRKQNKFYLSL